VSVRCNFESPATVDLCKTPRPQYSKRDSPTGEMEVE
jgi:hypothetical protein